MGVSFRLWVRGKEFVGRVGEGEKALEAARTEGKVVVGVPPSAVLRTEFEKVFGERFKGIQNRGAGFASRIRNFLRR